MTHVKVDLSGVESFPLQDLTPPLLEGDRGIEILPVESGPVVNPSDQDASTWQDVPLDYPAGAVIVLAVVCGLIVSILVVVCCLCCHTVKSRTDEEERLVQAAEKQCAAKRKMGSRTISKHTQSSFVVRPHETEEHVDGDKKSPELISTKSEVTEKDTLYGVCQLPDRQQDLYEVRHMQDQEKVHEVSQPSDQKQSLFKVSHLPDQLESSYDLQTDYKIMDGFGQQKPEQDLFDVSELPRRHQSWYDQHTDRKSGDLGLKGVEESPCPNCPTYLPYRQTPPGTQSVEGDLKVQISYGDSESAVYSCQSSFIVMSDESEQQLSSRQTSVLMSGGGTSAKPSPTSHQVRPSPYHPSLQSTPAPSSHQVRPSHNLSPQPSLASSPYQVNLSPNQGSYQSPLPQSPYQVHISPNHGSFQPHPPASSHIVGPIPSPAPPVNEDAQPYPLHTSSQVTASAELQPTWVTRYRQCPYHGPSVFSTSELAASSSAQNNRERSAAQPLSGRQQCGESFQVSSDTIFFRKPGHSSPEPCRQEEGSLGTSSSGKSSGFVNPPSPTEPIDPRTRHSGEGLSEQSTSMVVQPSQSSPWISSSWFQNPSLTSLRHLQSHKHVSTSQDGDEYKVSFVHAWKNTSQSAVTSAADSHTDRHQNGLPCEGGGVTEVHSSSGQSCCCEVTAASHGNYQHMLNRQFCGPSRPGEKHNTGGLPEHVCSHAGTGLNTRRWRFSSGRPPVKGKQPRQQQDTTCVCSACMEVQQIVSQSLPERDPVFAQEDEVQLLTTQASRSKRSFGITVAPHVSAKWDDSSINAVPSCYTDLSGRQHKCNDRDRYFPRVFNQNRNDGGIPSDLHRSNGKQPLIISPSQSRSTQVSSAQSLQKRSTTVNKDAEQLSDCAYEISMGGLAKFSHAKNSSMGAVAQESKGCANSDAVSQALSQTPNNFSSVSALNLNDERKTVGFSDEIEMVGFSNERNTQGFNNEKEMVGLNNERGILGFVNSSVKAEVPLRNSSHHNLSRQVSNQSSRSSPDHDSFKEIQVDHLISDSMTVHVGKSRSDHTEQRDKALGLPSDRSSRQTLVTANKSHRMGSSDKHRRHSVSRPGVKQIKTVHQPLELAVKRSDRGEHKAQVIDHFIITDRRKHRGVRKKDTDHRKVGNNEDVSASEKTHKKQQKEKYGLHYKDYIKKVRQSNNRPKSLASFITTEAPPYKHMYTKLRRTNQDAKKSERQSIRSILHKDLKEKLSNADSKTRPPRRNIHFQMDKRRVSRALKQFGNTPYAYNNLPFPKYPYYLCSSQPSSPDKRSDVKRIVESRGMETRRHELDRPRSPSFSPPRKRGKTVEPKSADRFQEIVIPPDRKVSGLRTTYLNRSQFYRQSPPFRSWTPPLTHGDGMRTYETESSNYQRELETSPQRIQAYNNEASHYQYDFENLPPNNVSHLRNVFTAHAKGSCNPSLPNVEKQSSPYEYGPPENDSQLRNMYLYEDECKREDYVYDYEQEISRGRKQYYKPIRQYSSKVPFPVYPYYIYTPPLPRKQIDSLKSNEYLLRRGASSQDRLFMYDSRSDKKRRHGRKERTFPATNRSTWDQSAPFPTTCYPFLGSPPPKTRNGDAHGSTDSDSDFSPGHQPWVSVSELILMYNRQSQKSGGKTLSLGWSRAVSPSLSSLSPSPLRKTLAQARSSAYIPEDESPSPGTVDHLRRLFSSRFRRRGWKFKQMPYHRSTVAPRPNIEEGLPATSVSSENQKRIKKDKKNTVFRLKELNDNTFVNDQALPLTDFPSNSSSPSPYLEDTLGNTSISMQEEKTRPHKSTSQSSVTKQQHTNNSIGYINPELMQHHYLPQSASAHRHQGNKYMDVPFYHRAYRQPRHAIAYRHPRHGNVYRQPSPILVRTESIEKCHGMVRHLPSDTTACHSAPKFFSNVYISSPSPSVVLVDRPRCATDPYRLQRAGNRTLSYPRFPYYPSSVPSSFQHDASLRNENDEIEKNPSLEWDYRNPPENMVANLTRKFIAKSEASSRPSWRHRSHHHHKRLKRKQECSSASDELEVKDSAESVPLTRTKSPTVTQDGVARVRRELLKQGVKLTGRFAPRKRASRNAQKISGSSVLPSDDHVYVVRCEMVVTPRHFEKMHADRAGSHSSMRLGQSSKVEHHQHLLDESGTLEKKGSRTKDHRARRQSTQLESRTEDNIRRATSKPSNKLLSSNSSSTNRVLAAATHFTSEELAEARRLAAVSKASDARRHSTKPDIGHQPHERRQSHRKQSSAAVQKASHHSSLTDKKQSDQQESSGQRRHSLKTGTEGFRRQSVQDGNSPRRHSMKIETKRSKEEDLIARRLSVRKQSSFGVSASQLGDLSRSRSGNESLSRSRSLDNSLTRLQKHSREVVPLALNRQRSKTEGRSRRDSVIGPTGVSQRRLSASKDDTRRLSTRAEGSAALDIEAIRHIAGRRESLSTERHDENQLVQNTEGLQRGESREKREGLRRGHSRENKESLQRGQSRENRECLHRQSRENKEGLQRGHLRESREGLHKGHSRENKEGLQRRQSRENREGLHKGHSRENKEGLQRGHSRENKEGLHKEHSRVNKEGLHRHSRENKEGLHKGHSRENKGDLHKGHSRENKGGLHRGNSGQSKDNQHQHSVYTSDSSGHGDHNVHEHVHRKVSATSRRHSVDKRSAVATRPDDAGHDTAHHSTDKHPHRRSSTAVRRQSTAMPVLPEVESRHGHDGRKQSLASRRHSKVVGESIQQQPMNTQDMARVDRKVSKHLTKKESAASRTHSKEKTDRLHSKDSKIETGYVEEEEDDDDDDNDS